MVLPEAPLDLSRITAGHGPILALLAGAVLVGRAGPLAGQVFPSGPGPYDPAVPEVAEIRGFPTGAGFTTTAEILRVLERVASVSPRVVLERYGRTAEGRPLVLAWISAPGNLARLARLRSVNVGLSRAVDPASVPAGHPLFVWLSFGVHGDEPAGPEAALELVYHLAAARDPNVRAWLERMVVVVDPLQNPDGHARYVRWYLSVAGPEPDPRPRAAEHRPPWPTGRTNGLQFDLNRDWAWGVMPETRARWKAYLATLPQVLVDFHEMDSGSSYFFFPPAEPVHPLLPASLLAWARIFGEANARAFRARGWAYYSGRDFDLLYPGYGDAWSSFHGATGMTYEQAGGGRAGVALATASGVLSLDERVEHHLQAALATLGAAAARSDERLRDFARFWARGRMPPDRPAFYLVPPSPGVRELALLLLAQGVRVEATAAPVDPDRVSPLQGAASPVEPLPEGTLVIATDQPMGRFAAAMMDSRSLVGTATSDISAWSLPLLFDVPAYAADEGLATPRVEWRPETPEIDLPAGTTALAWGYGSLTDALVAVRLAARGEPVHLAERPFVLSGQVRPRGTFVVRVDPGSPDRTREIARELASLGIRTEIVRDRGRAGGLPALRVPRVAIVAGEPVLETSLGAVRHLLARAGVDADELRLDELAWRALADYDVIVLPDGVDFERYARWLVPAGKRLEAWVEEGGTLVGVRGGAAALALGGGGEGLDLEAAIGTSSRPGRGAGRGRAADPMQGGVPGVLMGVRIDASDILGQGFSDGKASVMAWDPVLLERSEGDAAWRFADAPARTARFPANAHRVLAGRPYALVRANGQGRVVLFADDPGFRGMLPALAKLYLNALVLLPGVVRGDGAGAAVGGR
ncbi:MAG: M14 family zinc carboxypeptidase [Gemmatimonadota bacterium]